MDKNLSIFDDIKVADYYPSKDGEKSPLIEKKTASIITKLFIGGVPPCMDKDSLADLFMEARETSNLPACK